MFKLTELLKNNKKLTQDHIVVIEKFLDFDVIKKLVCWELNLPERVFFAKIRKQEIVNARQLFCYITKIVTGETLYNIADYLDQDHSNIHHSVKTVNNMIKYNKKHEIVRAIPAIYYNLMLRGYINNHHES